MIRLVRNRPLLLLSLWTGLLLVIHSPAQSFMAHDEGYYSQQARMVLESGDWISQHWFGTLVYDRAMGLIWLIAASQALFGFSEVASRLPSMLSSFGAVFLTYAIGTRLLARETALLGGAILAATPVWMQASKLATQDVPLALVTLLAVWALLRAEESPRRLAWGLVAGAAFSTAFSLKSFMVVPICGALAPYMLWEHRRHGHLRNAGLYLGAVVGLLPTIVWQVLSFRSYGWFPITNELDKLLFLASKDFHNAGPFYYLWNVPLTAFPWPLFAIVGAAMVWCGDDWRRKTLFLGFPLILLIELTAFRTRTWYYALQLLPFLAILAAVALAGLTRLYCDDADRRHMTLARVAAILGVTLVLTSLIVVLRPQLVEPMPATGLTVVGLLGGAGLIMPLFVSWLGRRKGFRAPTIWSASWLAGPWLAIAALLGTGLWGDYGARIKHPLTTAPLRQVLESNRVELLSPLQNYPHSGEEAVLLALYTPNLGDRYTDPSRLPEGVLVWVHRDDVTKLQFGFDEVGIADNWVLLRFRR